jgi:hypothetical protein
MPAMAVHYIRKGEVKLKPTEFTNRQIALAMYGKGKSFIKAGVLLDQRDGEGYVVLYLLCQGIEIVLKAILLMKDYDTHYPKMTRRGYGHNLEKLADAA